MLLTMFYPRVATITADKYIANSCNRGPNVSRFSEQRSGY